MHWLWPTKDIPAIESLDLRKLNEPMYLWDWCRWDWPEFPAKVAYFIATGKQMPTWRTISVKIIGSVVNQAHASAYAIQASHAWLAAFNALPTRRYRPMRKWHWHRIFFVLSALCAYWVVAVVLVTWIWQQWK